MDGEKTLVFVKPAGNGIEHGYQYELFFSSTPDIVWGPDWSYENPSICTGIEPDITTYCEKKTISTSLPFKTAMKNSCLSMEYCTVGILALAWIDIENLDEYPEHGRCVLHFGMTEDEVNGLLEPYII